MDYKEKEKRLFDILEKYNVNILGIHSDIIDLIEECEQDRYDDGRYDESYAIYMGGPI